MYAIKYTYLYILNNIRFSIDQTFILDIIECVYKIQKVKITNILLYDWYILGLRLFAEFKLLRERESNKGKLKTN